MQRYLKVMPASQRHALSRHRGHTSGGNKKLSARSRRAKAPERSLAKAERHQLGHTIALRFIDRGIRLNTVPRRIFVTKVAHAVRNALR